MQGITLLVEKKEEASIKKELNPFIINQKQKPFNIILKKACKTINSILYLHSQYRSTARSYKHKRK